MLCFYHELSVSCCEITQILLLCYLHLHLQVCRLQFEDDAPAVIPNSEQIISLLFPVSKLHFHTTDASKTCFQKDKLAATRKTSL